MIKAKKQFGQNFLIDKSVLSKIIQAIPKGVYNIVEIGPGLGDLTAELLKISEVESYEIDVDLYKILLDKFSQDIQKNRLKLHLGDVVDTWQKSGLSKKRYFLVANLPYYVATRIILDAIDDELCEGFVIMIQKEVADKFCALGGEREFSALSVLGNLQGECKSLFDVLPQAFNPPPKVVSSVIKLEKKDSLFCENSPFADKKEYVEFKDFLKICFVSPRKTLTKNLSSKFDKSLVNEAFDKLNLDKNLRAHQLNNALFIKIFNFLKAGNGKQRE
ncbi:16S rRNA (adenine(1518)-N(6)/adenine(1519)-N(6))-dimethyltransferase RsmA [Campylobacter geochelonis]|uniref:16S rRNA (adenine(1518)-N(6)/adenine(1519)-N(6))- dimethyltransferase RsmA n=1 Tax=Campylobacter geochelonis TaxID=1780362 RepID=UPI0007709A2F|nr:16S rRNA (adenine(1518)-N(6)/adenine(1519)-N(6))-dimethyltransferase RsmA [Campylobacter geochelonis]CZE46373.1 dimethyladenosine transferase [Campylobacter geochelonis]